MLPSFEAEGPGSGMGSSKAGFRKSEAGLRTNWGGLVGLPGQGGPPTDPGHGSTRPRGGRSHWSGRRHPERGHRRSGMGCPPLRPRVPQVRAGGVAYRARALAGACPGASRTGVGSTGDRGRLSGGPGWGGGPTGMGPRTHRTRGVPIPGAVRRVFGAGFRPGPRMYALARLEM